MTKSANPWGGLPRTFRKRPRENREVYVLRPRTSANIVNLARQFFWASFREMPQALEVAPETSRVRIGRRNYSPGAATGSSPSAKPDLLGQLWGAPQKGQRVAVTTTRFPQ